VGDDPAVKIKGTVTPPVMGAGPFGCGGDKAVRGFYRCVVGTVLWLAMGLAAGVVLFVSLAMDAGRYSWATQLVARFIDRLVSGARALIRPKFGTFGRRHK
jgi:hypothetical protein